jgi:hypothetical protein
MIYLVKGDIGSQIKATLTRDETGLPVNLTDATVVLKVTEFGSNDVLFTITAQALGAVSAAAGIAVFLFTQSNLDSTPGRYEGEIEITFSGGQIETVYDRIQIIIRDDMQ